MEAVVGPSFFSDVLLTLFSFPRYSQNDHGIMPASLFALRAVARFALGVAGARNVSSAKEGVTNHHEVGLNHKPSSPAASSLLFLSRSLI